VDGGGGDGRVVGVDIGAPDGAGEGAGDGELKRLADAVAVAGEIERGGGDGVDGGSNGEGDVARAGAGSIDGVDGEGVGAGGRGCAGEDAGLEELWSWRKAGRLAEKLAGLLVAVMV